MSMISTEQKTQSQELQKSTKSLQKTLNLWLLFVLSLMVSGCASIAGNNTRQVMVTSEPIGAAVYIDNQRYGTTPAIVTMPTYIYGGKTLMLKKEGYQDQTMRINSEFQPIALLDILCWPTILIDIATGNIVKIDPANLNLYASLQKAEVKSAN